MLTLAAAGITLGAPTLAVCCLLVIAAILIAFGVGYGTGRQREREQLFEQARQNGVDPQWLVFDAGSDGE